MKAVVFDMDGVLFDTETLCMEVWVRVAEEKGLPDMRGFFPKCIGRNSADTKLLFQEEYGTQTDYGAFKAEASLRFREHIDANGVPLKEGVTDILPFLRGSGYRIALASSSSRDSVLSLIEKAGIRDYFEVVITGDMIQHSKPLPDIYLLACEKLGVAPAQAYAIEDSYNGIRSAYAAGMAPIMVPDMLPPDREMEEKSLVICKNLHAVMTYLNFPS